MGNDELNVAEYIQYFFNINCKVNVGRPSFSYSMIAAMLHKHYICEIRSPLHNLAIILNLNLLCNEEAKCIKTSTVDIDYTLFLT